MPSYVGGNHANNVIDTNTTINRTANVFRICIRVCVEFLSFLLKIFRRQTLNIKTVYLLAISTFLILMRKEGKKLSLGQIVYLDLDKIHANNYNPNVMSGEKFEALKDFCQTHGAEQLDPVWVRRDGAMGFEVIDGAQSFHNSNVMALHRL